MSGGASARPAAAKAPLASIIGAIAMFLALFVSAYGAIGAGVLGMILARLGARAPLAVILNSLAIILGGSALIMGVIVRASA